MLGDLFEAKNVTVLTGHKLVQVTEQGVVLENADGTVELEADSVVSAIGFAPRESLKTYSLNAAHRFMKSETL